MTPTLFDPDRLRRMHDTMAGYVQRGDLPGIVTLVSRGDELHVDTHGTLAFDSTAPMQRDTIFRIASMTKPILAVGALILIEECRMQLDDAVSKWLPELADMRVLRDWQGPLDDTVPAERDITVRDVLTYRIGSGMAFPDGDESIPILQALEEQELSVLGGERTMLTQDAWLSRFGSLPLMTQPGATWHYHTSAFVLAALVSRVSGQPMHDFLHERIFEPLGMHDTAFQITDADLPRLTTAYNGDMTVFDGVEDSQWRTSPSFPTGGGELLSTVGDYLAFSRMLMNEGSHNGTRILARPTVLAMCTDMITAEQRASSPNGNMFLGNLGWGMGVAVIKERDSTHASPGAITWSGGFGTSWRADPSEDLHAILMTQGVGFTSGIYDAFWTSVYQALGD